MELEEVLEVSVLLNYYKNLLTDKQKDYLIEHLEEDMSLSEIAMLTILEHSSFV